MQRGIDASAHDREDCHRFGEAIDACSPVLFEEEQNGGDQRSGVADADPEHEVHDRPAPRDGLVVAPHTHAGGDQQQDGQAQHARAAGADEQQHPPHRRGRHQVETGDRIGHAANAFRAVIANG